ncbi:MAG: peptidase C13 [Alphaproteobacteria bacterium]|nr:peptidase C13 [Alphaproteobacteria bacterium]MBV9694449.1 peptidase C13 [Alphaproteobacteria bacterium]
MRLLLAIFLVVAETVLWSAARAAGYADWAAIVVAGDFHAHSGAESEVFDNARRDIAADLMSVGFAPDNIIQFSVRPEGYPLQHPRHSDGQTIGTTMWDLSNRTSGGCFAYLTSHGSPDGIVVGDDTLSPVKLKSILDNACGDSPTVVFLSACYSGVFIPVLAAKNRMIVTAARRDRTSFGCGETYKYTFFDDCFLQSFRKAGNFPDVARGAASCVAAREKKEGFRPPSEPQISIGSDIAATLAAWGSSAPMVAGDAPARRGAPSSASPASRPR